MKTRIFAAMILVVSVAPASTAWALYPVCEEPLADNRDWRPQGEIKVYIQKDLASTMRHFPTGSAWTFLELRRELGNAIGALQR